MGESELEVIARWLAQQASQEIVRVTQHAQQEMAEEEILLTDVLSALRRGRILEHYPDHRRGSCCLVCGYTGSGRPLHLVCTTQSPVILITVYEPKPPKWETPTQRGNKS
jgi:hypothetical protein